MNQNYEQVYVNFLMRNILNERTPTLISLFSEEELKRMTNDVYNDRHRFRVGECSVRTAQIVLSSNVRYFSSRRWSYPALKSANHSLPNLDKWYDKV